jgi:hypothetical protein
MADYQGDQNKGALLNGKGLKKIWIGCEIHTPNFEAEWLPFLLSIQKFLGSNLCLETESWWGSRIISETSVSTYQTIHRNIPQNTDLNACLTESPKSHVTSVEQYWLVQGWVFRIWLHLVGMISESRLRNLLFCLNFSAVYLRRNLSAIRRVFLGFYDYNT